MGHQDHQDARLGSRRHPGHARRDGGEGRLRGAAGLRRPRRLPAHHRQRVRAVPQEGRQRHSPDGRGRHPGEVLRQPGPVLGPRRPGGRERGQPARRSRRRTQDGGQMDQPLRRPRGRPGEPRRDRREGGGLAPRKRRGRQAQPAAQPAPHRSRTARHAGGPRGPAAGPGRPRGAVRRPRIQDHPHPALCPLRQ